jgi:hypothetical protein
MNMTAGGTTLTASSTEFALQYSWSQSGPWTNVGWWNASWLSRKKITFDNTGATTSDLTSFAVPVCLRATANAICGAIDYSKTQNSGQDIRFVDANGTTTLPYEIEKWDETGTSTVWVKVPKINNATTTDYIWMYYNNTGASDAQATTTVWSGSDAQGVWHMGNYTATTNAFTDSTSNANHGSGYGGSSLASTTGKIGGAYSFNTDDYVMTSSLATTVIDNWSMSAWVYPTSINQYGVIIHNGNETGGTGDGYSLVIGNCGGGSGAKLCGIANGLAFLDSGYSFPAANAWYHIEMLRSSGTTKFYVNGQQTPNTFTQTYNTPTSRFTMGSFQPWNLVFFNGWIDDVRVYSRAQTEAEVIAQYKAGAGAFLSYGEEESEANVPFTFYNGNSSATDGANITSTLLSASTILETYESANFTATSSQYAIPSGSVGEWDFALDPANATTTTYYFRLVKADGSVALDTYTLYPALVVNTPSLTFSISGNSAGFGTLSSAAARYASSTASGDASDLADAHTMTASTTATGGYTITVNGTTLTSGANTIATSSTAAASSPGTEQFGLRLVVNSGNGSAASPYSTANQFAFDSINFPDQVASGSGDSVTTVFGVRYIGNIAANTEAGSYGTTLTYIATATF